MATIFDSDPLIGTIDDALSGLTEDELLSSSSNNSLNVEEIRSRIRDRENLDLLAIATTSSNPVLLIATNPTDPNTPTLFDNKGIAEVNDDTTLLSLSQDKSLSSVNDSLTAGGGDQSGTQGQNSLISDATTSSVTNSSSNPSALAVNNMAPSAAPAPPQPAVKPATLDDTNGKDGIDSRELLKLGLTGKGIAIGQVEGGRPGKPGFDNAANSNLIVQPKEVFVQDKPAKANENTATHEGHATMVAGVMIAKADTGAGVAPNALLYASATDASTQAETALSAQYVILQSGEKVRAINFSFGQKPEGADKPNGNSLLTQFVDWSARQHNVLYVKSRGNIAILRTVLGGNRSVVAKG